MQTAQRIRQLVKLSLASMLQYTGLMSLLRTRVMQDRAAILMYHRVVDKQEARFDYAPNGMVVTDTVFEKHIRYLSKHYHTVTMDQLCDNLENQNIVSTKPLLAVTFDDGWLDNWTQAIPILNKYNVPATIFIGCNFIENKEWYWLERVKFVLAHAHKMLLLNKLSSKNAEQLRSELATMGYSELGTPHISNLGLYLNNITGAIDANDDLSISKALSAMEHIASLSELDEKTYFMDWDTVKKLPAHGIEIGAHTVTHTDLTKLNADQVTNEIEQSKQILERKLTVPVNNFAFPYGKNSESTQDIVRSAGFRSACSTLNGLIDSNSKKYLLNRINMHTDVSLTTPMFAYRILAL